MAQWELLSGDRGVRWGVEWFKIWIRSSLLLYSDFLKSTLFLVFWEKYLLLKYTLKISEVMKMLLAKKEWRAFFQNIWQTWSPLKVLHIELISSLGSFADPCYWSWRNLVHLIENSLIDNIIPLNSFTCKYIHCLDINFFLKKPLSWHGQQNKWISIQI